MNRSLPAALALLLALASSSSALESRNGGPNDAGKPGHCAKGTYRTSMPDEPLQCWPVAPVCPAGTKLVKGNDLAHAWMCLNPHGDNIAKCPANMVVVLVPGRGSGCMPKAAPGSTAGGSGGAGGDNPCPPGTHGVLTHSWGQPYQCVKNLNNYNQGLNGGSGAGQPGGSFGAASSAGFGTMGGGNGGGSSSSGSGGACSNGGDRKCNCGPCGAGGHGH